MFKTMADVPAGLLITGARVYTGIQATPWAEAILTDGGRIRFVGSEAEARRLALPGTHEIRVPNGLATAGFTDSHIHTDWGAYDLTILNLEGVTTLPHLQRRLRDYVNAHPDREWIEGYGVFYEVWEGLEGAEREALDAAVADRPVLVKAFDTHSAWCNSLAMQRAGIERGADISPPNEVVVDTVDGRATGMLKEGALALVARVMDEPSEGDRERMLSDALRYLNSCGITSVQNMKENLGVLRRWQRVHERGELTVRAYHYLIVEESTPRDYLEECKRYTREFRGDWNRAGGIKMFMDGVVESKTAWMSEPYADGSGDAGVPNISPRLFSEVVLAADWLDLDVAVHAVGEQAVRHVLDSYEAAQERNGGRRGRRHRIEHIETILPADISRLGRLGVTASMQPLHAAPTTDPRDTPWTRLVGPRREPYAFPWRRLADTDAVLAYGSDWPVVSADVRLGLHAAVTRRSAAGEPVGGWEPQQCVTLEEAIRAYTYGAAYAERSEHRKGTLRPGMLADITVFGRDLFSLHPEEILTTDVALTVVDGRVVHRSGVAVPV